MKGKRIRKVTSLLLTLVLLFSLIIVPTNAAVKEYRLIPNYGLVDAGYHYTALLGVREWESSAYVGGLHLVYCSDVTIYTDTTINYFVVDLAIGEVRAILMSSYPNVSLAALEIAAGLPAGVLTSQDAITATQFAIWKYTNPSVPALGPLTADQQAVYDYLMGLPAVPANATAPSSAAFTAVTNTILSNGDVEIVVSYPVNATSTNSDTTLIPLSLTYSIDIGAVYAGSTIVQTTDGTTNTETITIPSAAFTSDISFSAMISGMQNIFDANEYISTDLREDSQPLVGFINREIEVTASANIEVLIEDASIEIFKTIQGRPGDMTLFDVIITGPGEYQESIHISQSGSVLLSELEYGTYTLTEVLPAGYHAVGANPKIVIISEEITSAKVTFENALTPVINYGTITVVKEVSNVEDDPTEFEVVINGTFKLYVIEGTSASINLPIESSYTIVETAVEGYNNISITPSTFTLTTAGQVVTVVNEKIIPPPTGEITISKGFEGDVVDETGFTVDITGPNGYTNSVVVVQGSPVVISGLELGEYILTEQGKEGYVTVSEETVTITLIEDGADVTFINAIEEIIIPPVNPPGDLPETGGVSPVNYFGFGCLIVLTGILVLFIQKKKEEMCS